MGVEVLEAKVAATEPEKEAGLSLDDGANIKFGSHNVDEKLNGDINGVPESNLQKNAADEWPQPQQIHSFFIVKCRPFEDQKLKDKMELAEKELQKKKQARLQIIEKIKSKRADRVQVITEIRNLSVENKQYRTMMDEKKKEMEPLQQALGKLRGASGGRDKGSSLCSSEEELNDLIRSYQHRIQHESITLNEEKQILREIRQLEGTRERVIANAAERAMIEGSMGEKGVLQDQVKSIGVDLDGVRKEKQLINAKLKRHDEEKLAIEKEILTLEDELSAVTESRDNIFEKIKELRKQRDDGNSPFYQNRALLTKAKSLAADKNIDALIQLCNAEEENFMLLWNSQKSFRDDYVRRILPSLDMRQFSGDGRLRNSDEKPLSHVKTSPPETEDLKATAKQIQHDSDAVVVDLPSDKASKTKDSKQKEGNKKLEKTKERTDVLEEEEEFFIETLPRDPLPKVEVDPVKLKELKREEEIAKRIQAEERKKKLAEKAAAKATIKAQKEAEKKLKEREKRARKKAGASAASPDDAEEPTEAAVEDAELTKKEEIPPETPLPQKNKESKEAPIRRRTRVPRSRVDSLPKAVLKRKKSVNYWLWAVPAGLAVVLLLTLGFLYTR